MRWGSFIAGLLLLFAYSALASSFLHHQGGVNPASYSGTLTITAQPTSNSVLQRDTRSGGALNKGKGAVAIGLNPSVSALSLQYRLRDFNSSSTTLVNWTDSGLGALSSGTQTITLNLDADNHQFILDLRANNDSTSLVSTTNAFAVGSIFCMAGQSQALQEIGRVGYNTSTINATDSTHTIAAGTNRNISIGATSWLNASYRPLGTGSTPVLSGWLQARDAPTTPLWASMLGARIGNLVNANEGVAFALCGAATGNTGITYWKSGGEGNADLKAGIAAIGGKFEVFYYYQGTADVGASPAATNWQNNLISIIDDLAATYPSATFKTVISNITSVGGAASPQFNQLLRVAGQNVADHYNGIASNSAAFIADLDGQTESADVHHTTYGDDVHALHIYRAWQKLWSGTGAGDDGPQITGCTRATSSNVVQCTVTQASGGTALAKVTTSPAPGGNTTPSDATLGNQFLVYFSPTTYDGSGNVTATAVTVSSATLVSATEIDLTLGSTPANSQALDIWYRLPPDSATVVSTAIYDNNSSDGPANIPVGRQLRFAPTAFTAAAPGP